MIAALSGGSALAAGADTSPNAAGHTVKFQDGTIVPAIGQGSWHLGQGRHPAAVEEEALRLGVSLGMRLIDTAENYGDGRSEELISHAIAGQRDRVFLVSKVETNHVTGDSIARACESSLARLGTDYLDLYLLHWPVPSGQFPGVVPWCKAHDMLVMAYSPLGGDSNLLVGDHTLAGIGAIHDCSAAAVALAWVIRNGKSSQFPNPVSRRMSRRTLWRLH